MILFLYVKNALSLIALFVIVSIFSCAKLDQERSWDNPLDPNGNNYYPPIIISFNDSVKIAWPYKKVEFTVAVMDSNNKVQEYLWSIDNGLSWSSTGNTPHFIYEWKDTTEFGMKKILVNAKGTVGPSSATDTFLIDLHLFKPILTPVKDTIASQDGVVIINMPASDTADSLEYFYDQNLNGWDDSATVSIVDTQFSHAFSKPEGGPLFVHWAIRDGSGFSLGDTFMIYFNMRPTVPQIIVPENDTIKKFITYDYENKTGSISLEFNAKDQDNPDSSLTFTLEYQVKDDINTIHTDSTGLRKMQLDSIKDSSIYIWNLTVKDPCGNASVSNGRFFTPPPPFHPDGMKLIKCRDSTFFMGQNGSDSTSLPIHTVSFGNNFWIDTTEVTCEKFYNVLAVQNQPVPFPRTPITNITWYDAVVYCNALSKIFRLDTFYIFTAIKGSIGSQCQLENVTFNINANGYRLPTEAQWEYACRSRRNSLFFWGDDIYKIVEYAWTSSSNVSTVNDVAQLKPNPYGLYDMAGNVWEWCHDWFDKDYYIKSATTNPMGPHIGTEKVIRGGSVINHYFFAQSGTRSKLLPTQYNSYTGFRTVLIEEIN